MKIKILLLFIFVCVTCICMYTYTHIHAQTIGEELYTLIPVTVTAYTACPSECDSTPFITASNKTIYIGVIALSRDIEKDLGLKFGETIYVKGIGHFTFEDRMNKRWKRRVDIYIWKQKKRL